MTPECDGSQPGGRVSDGTRTRDRLDHNQELYQLSYAHQAGGNLAVPWSAACSAFSLGEEGILCANVPVRIRGPAERRGMDEAKGAGWLLFAGIMVLIAGTLNCIWGIAAIDDATFFLEDERFVISDLATWGWIVLGVGIIQVIAAFSIWAGGEFGRWIGIIGASLSAVAALLTIPAYPFWALVIFGVDVLIIYGLGAYGGQRTT